MFFCLAISLSHARIQRDIHTEKNEKDCKRIVFNFLTLERESHIITLLAFNNLLETFSFALKAQHFTWDIDTRKIIIKTFLTNC